MTQEIIDTLERQYIDKLDERCTRWQTKHPAEAKELRESVSVRFRKPGTGDPEAGSLQWQMIEAAVNEAIRHKHNWPTFRRWLSERPPVTPFAPSPSIRPASLNLPEDRKAKAACE